MEVAPQLAELVSQVADGSSQGVFGIGQRFLHLVLEAAGHPPELAHQMTNRPGRLRKPVGPEDDQRDYEEQDQLLRPGDVDHTPGVYRGSTFSNARRRPPGSGQDRAMDSLLQPPIGFAHRGARADAPENTLEAFDLARKLGATGLESDVWLTADGVPVLDHDGLARRHWWRRERIKTLARAALPAYIPTLSDLYEHCGTDFELSLDVKDAEAFEAVLTIAHEMGDEAAARLWLCHSDWQLLQIWRTQSTRVKLVNSIRLRSIKEGPERRAATLADAGIDAINMHAADWTGGLTTLFHRFERLAFAWDAQFDRVLRALLRMGCDAVYSDHVDRMVGALQQIDR